MPDELTAPYWEGTRRHELVLQRCASCGTYVHPPRYACRVCQGLELVPTVVKPHGTVYSYTVTHTAFVPGFEEDVPYVLVLVDLDVGSGVRLETILRDCPIAEVVIGMAVDIIFEDVSEEVTLPYAVPDRRSS